MINGFATHTGTTNFANKNIREAGKNHFKRFDGLLLSSLGMGTYLGNIDDATDFLVKEAVKKSILSGINVIDTAINYRAQKAERSVGRAIAELIDDGKIKRDEIFISTKNGYLTNDGDINKGFDEYLQTELIVPGIINPDDISSGHHCMTIPYLEDQLNRSLKNLGLERIDLIYLHNAIEGQIRDISKSEFMKRLKEVFVFYEEQRRKGKITYYGMATWECFRAPPDNKQHLSLTEVIDLAKDACGNDNGFKFIQMPYNMNMIQALTIKNNYINGKQVSVLEAAIELGVGVFASVPLMQAKLLESDIIPDFGGLRKISHRALQFVRSTPGIIAPLVGHKTRSHVDENLELIKVPLMSKEEYSQIVQSVLK